MLFTQDTNTNPAFKPLYINITFVSVTYTQFFFYRLEPSVTGLISTKKNCTTQEKLSVQIQTFRPRRVRRDRFSLTLIAPMYWICRNYDLTKWSEEPY